MHNVLIAGVGSIGERHLRCFGATGRARLAICEINGELRERVGDLYQIERRFDNFDAALADGFDSVVIATPAHLHIAMAQQAAEAGAHLLIEKPLATSPDGIDALIQTIEHRRLTAAVAYVYRANPLLAAMKAALDADRFGRPLEVVAVGGQHFPTYRPAYRDIYYRDHATGGGAIQDALTHVYNAVEWLVGPADRLVADAEHLVLDGVEVEDTVHVLARHGDVLASYSLNQHQAPNETSITVVCQRGSVRLEIHHGRWRWITEPGGRWQDGPEAPLQRDELFTAQASAFLDAVEHRAAPLCTLQQAAATLRMNLATLKSARDGSWQEL